MPVALGRIRPLRGHSDVVFGPALGEGGLGRGRPCLARPIELDEAGGEGQFHAAGMLDEQVDDRRR